MDEEILKACDHQFVETNQSKIDILKDINT